MKVTQIEKLNQLISRADMTGNQKVEWLTNFIDEHVTEQLRLNGVSQAKRTVCPDCGDRGWLYDDEGRRAGTCPCHY